MLIYLRIMLPFEMKGNCNFTEHFNHLIVWLVGTDVANWLWDLMELVFAFYFIWCYDQWWVFKQ